MFKFITTTFIIQLLLLMNYAYGQQPYCQDLTKDFHLGSARPFSEPKIYFIPLKCYELNSDGTAGKEKTCFYDRNVDYSFSDNSIINGEIRVYQFQTNGECLDKAIPKAKAFITLRNLMVIKNVSLQVKLWGISKVLKNNNEFNKPIYNLDLQNNSIADLSNEFAGTEKIVSIAAGASEGNVGIKFDLTPTLRDKSGNSMKALNSKIVSIADEFGLEFVNRSMKFNFKFPKDLIIRYVRTNLRRPCYNCTNYTDHFDYNSSTYADQNSSTLSNYMVEKKYYYGDSYFDYDHELAQEGILFDNVETRNINEISHVDLRKLLKSYMSIH